MSTSRLRRVALVLALAAALAAQPALGLQSYDPAAEAERELLRRYLAELDSASALLRQARRTAGGLGHRRFDYARLAQDLRILRAGILGYLRDPQARNSPEQWGALEGNYER